MEVRRQKLKVGDEVCRLIEAELVFGTLEHLPKKEGDGGGSRIWKVNWIHDPSLSVEEEVCENDLIPTDRSVYKGSRVRLGDKVGTCRGVLHKADMRILGTNSIIPDVNIEEFSHLKEFTQKSVVYFKGWLGIVHLTKRNATIQLSDKSATSQDLNRVLPSGPLHLELHWINEKINNFSLAIPVRRPDETNALKKARNVAFIKDLSVESVTVKWEHQIDPNAPDKPKQEFSLESHSQLQLIKESVAIDDSSFSFQVGNLGRLNLVKKRQSVLLRWDDWQRKFAKQNLPPSVASELRAAIDYEKCLASRYWRVYDNTLSGNRGEGDEDKENALKQAKSEPEVGDVVVEIAHIYTIPDIQWEDGTSEMPCSVDLEVLDATILSNTELPRPGDFITSKLLPQYPVNKTYLVVLHAEISSERKQSQLVVRVLDSEVPGKVVVNKTTIVGDDLRLSSKSVERHPVFQYFNEASTIVVVNEDGPDGVTVRIGCVVGTNLEGKVRVRFTQKTSEEWVWPQVCAIYSTKGYDLECVKSHVTDESDDQERKIREIIEKLETKVAVVWKNTSKSEQDLNNSLSEFKFLFNTLSSIYSRGNEVLQQESYSDLVAYLPVPVVGNFNGSPSLYLKGNNHVANLVDVAVTQLITQAKNLLPPSENLSASSSSSVEMLDLTNQCSQHAAADPLAEIFSKTVDILDKHPEGHQYSKTTTYNPANSSSCFMKSVREELVGLDKICSTETKSEMGILSRTYADRMDLLSFLIRGPEGTPYQDGLFLFDASLPAKYPEVPPQFHFHAFSAGRLNPNLYAEGKVCVSLLGTWAGQDKREQWTKDSNIVQILISIQGLILVNEPYHNEPGLEREKYSAADAEIHCRMYNTQLMPLVGQMMINQIRQGMEPFTEQIQAFYRIQVPIFLARWRNWLQGVGTPPFALVPLDPPFIVRMNKILDDLEEIWSRQLGIE